MRHVWLFWIEATEIATGNPVTAGFSTDADVRDYTIDAQVRTYHGAGAMASVDPIRSEAGLDVVRQTVRLALPDPSVELALRGYDVRLAPCELHLVLFDEDDQVDVIEKHFSGFVEKLDITVGLQTAAVLTLSSVLRNLTTPLPIKKSHEWQKRRSDDQFAKYADVSGSVTVWWGEKKWTPPPPAAPRVPLADRVGGWVPRDDN